MITVSNAFLAAMDLRRDFRCSAHITFANGAEIDLTDEDFSISGNAITDGASTDGLPLGVAVGKSIDIELMNEDGKFAPYSFSGAEIALFLEFNEESIPVGTFTVIDPETEGSTVIITANDGMHRADKEYDTALTYPATLSEIFTDACDRCGLAYVSDTFLNSDFEVMAKPANVTYRQIFGLVAMLAGGNAKINTGGEIEIVTYDFDAVPSQTLEDWFSLTIDTDDITISGLSIIKSEYVDGAVVSSTLLEGADGYVVHIDNPLVAGRESEALTMLRDVFIGKTFRKFSGEHLAYPLAEFMDGVNVMDVDGNTHFSVVTDIRFAFLGVSEFSNSASSAARVNSTYQVKANTDKKVDELSKELIAQITRTEEGLKAEVAQLKQQSTITMTKDQVEIAITEAVEGIDSVTTKTGYTFGADGLEIQKQGEEIKNKIDHTGLYVKRDEENVLTANNEGVNALNITVRKYLIVGKNSRFEDFVDEDGNEGTACFWIGG